MKLRAQALLDEVHQLALTYHWSWPDILRLPVLRRQAFLLRIEADLDRQALGDLEYEGSD